MRATSQADNPSDPTTHSALMPSSPSQPACPDGVSASHSETKWVGSSRVTGLSDEDSVGPKNTSRIQTTSTTTVPFTGSPTRAPTAAPTPR